MSQVAVTKLIYAHVSKDGNCIYCGCKLKICLVCDGWFRAGKSDNEICSSRCRTRKHRQKIRDELELDDE